MRLFLSNVLVNPRLFVVSGPSGAGKGTLLEKVRAQRQDLGLTVSATTRAPRPSEIDGQAYHFMSQTQFDEHLRKGDFLEWARVHGHCYATPKSEVDACLAKGQSVILEIDVQGALQVKERIPEAVLIFIEPPSLEVLAQRLRNRHTEAEKDIELRLANASKELSLADKYDARIVNDDLATAARELASCIRRYEAGDTTAAATTK
ncbi:guanylate kinase [Atopobium deltae]